MDRIVVSSTVIRSIGYEPSTRALEIEFKSGHVYQYERVPGSVYSLFLASASKGSYFNQHIQDRYRFHKVR
jgi:hypothetical protein